MSTCRFNRMVEWKKQCKDQKDQRRWNQTVTSLVHAVWATLYSWPLLAMYAFNEEKNSERYECPSAWGCPTSTATVTDSVTISADVNDTPSTAQRAWNESATSRMVLYHDGNCDPGGGRRMVCSELLWIHFDRSDNRSFRNGHNQTSITGTRCFGPPLNFSLRLYAQLLHQKMVFHVSTFTKCMTRILTSSKLRTSAYIY